MPDIKFKHLSAAVLGKKILNIFIFDHKTSRLDPGATFGTNLVAIY